MEYLHRENVRATTTSAEQFDSQTFFKEHLQRNDDGGYDVIGDNLNPMEQALLEIEKRRRGTQAVASREKVRADRFESELTKVKEMLPSMKPIDQIDESLRYSDPDEYIAQKLAQSRMDPYAEVFTTASRQAAEEVGRRTVQEELDMFNSNNPTRVITEDMLESDVPPRLVTDLKNGKITPQEFLGKAADMLYRPREVANQDLPKTPDLGSVAGQTTPTDDGSNDRMATSYSKAIF